MEVLYKTCKAMFILGVGGLVISFVFMLGAFLMQCPLWLCVAAAVITVTAGVIVHRLVDWL